MRVWLLRSETDGVITAIENQNAPDPDIYEIQFDYQVGDRVKKFHVGPASDRACHYERRDIRRGSEKAA